MKRPIIFIILSLFILMLTSCFNDPTVDPTITEPSITIPTNGGEEKDKVKPIINVYPTEVTLNYKEPYDLTTGLNAIDNIDGNITDQIEIDDDGFDNTKPGVYNIIYRVTDSSGNVGMAIRTITVKGLNKTDDGYGNNEVYTGIIEGEKPKPTTYSPYPGDWSRKAESSRDLWLGMEAVIILPEFIGDPDRYEDAYFRHLDNSSIYFGANAGRESDVGLLWEIGCVYVNGSCVLSKEKMAYRPFWRYITKEHDNIWANANDYQPENFYFPGDVLRMSVFVSSHDHLRLKIEVIEPTTIQKYVDLRLSLGVYYPADFLSPEYPSMGMGRLNARFMRVNAIDQYYNEGKITIPTNAVVTEMIWQEVYLYRRIEGTVYKVPFTEDRYIDYCSPDDDGFDISYDGVDKALGGEKVIMQPGEAKDYNPNLD